MATQKTPLDNAINKASNSWLELILAILFLVSIPALIFGAPELFVFVISTIIGLMTLNFMRKKHYHSLGIQTPEQLALLPNKKIDGKYIISLVLLWTSLASLVYEAAFLMFLFTYGDTLLKNAPPGTGDIVFIYMAIIFFQFMVTTTLWIVCGVYAKTYKDATPELPHAKLRTRAKVLAFSIGSVSFIYSAVAITLTYN